MLVPENQQQEIFLLNYFNKTYLELKFLQFMKANPSSPFPILYLMSSSFKWSKHEKSSLEKLCNCSILLNNILWRFTTLFVMALVLDQPTFQPFQIFHLHCRQKSKLFDKLSLLMFTWVNRIYFVLKSGLQFKAIHLFQLPDMCH